MKVVEQLVELGLTPDEAAVYELLVREGGLTANDISLHLKIIVNSIYRLTKDLQSQGLIKELDIRPKRFQAVPPALAIQQLANKQLARIETVAEAAIKRLGATSSQSPHHLNMGLMTGRKELFESYVNLAKKSKQEILVISVGEPVPETIWKVTKSKIKKGVSHKFIFHEYGKHNVMLYKRWQTMGVDVRHLPSGGYHLNIFDHSAAILSASNPKQSKERTGVVIYNEAVIEAMRSYFFQQWALAQKV